MINKLIFLNHEAFINNPSRETVSAGLGPVAQYGIILVALIVIAFLSYIIKRKKRNKG